MSGAQQSRGEPRSETKAKTNSAGPQGATRPVPPASPGFQGSARLLLLSRISNSSFYVVCYALSANESINSSKNVLISKLFNNKKNYAELMSFEHR